MRRRARKGSTLVESAIVLVLFLVLLIGILDAGQVLFLHNFLDERVRSAVRYAAVHTYDVNAIKNFAAYNDPVGPPGGGPGLFGLDPGMVQVARYDFGTPNARIEVSVTTFSMHFLSPWLAGTFTPRPFRASMPIESGGVVE
jgi:TadE-like protein